MPLTIHRGPLARRLAPPPFYTIFHPLAIIIVLIMRIRPCRSVSVRVRPCAHPLPLGIAR
jgi:hypothetical protein